MEYNPLAARLRAAERQLTALRRRRTAVAKQMAWANQFKPEVVAADLARLTAELQTGTEELERRRAKYSQEKATYRSLRQRTAGLEDKVRPGLNPGYWFSRTRTDAKKRLLRHQLQVQKHQQEVDAYKKQRVEAENVVQTLEGVCNEKQQELVRFHEFKLQEAQEIINRVDGELPFREMELQDLKVRKQEVDRRLQEPVKERTKCQAEVRRLQETIDDLIRQRQELGEKRRQAEELNRQISNEPNSYERRRLHAESERIFDNGSPGRVVSDVDHQLRELQRSVDYTKRQIARIERDSAKIEARIKSIAEIASRDIRMLIIDGKNLCFEGSMFIGLAALIPLTEILAKRYDVTVVFDASIRRDLAMSNQQLISALPTARVHVVASRAKADETLLATAHDSTAWVISNDRFSDYRDKAPVKEHRVIRHEILHGRVMIHDLNLATQFMTAVDDR